MDRLHAIHEHAKAEIAKALQQSKAQANKSCVEPPAFAPGDKVWLSSLDICTARPSKKVLEKRLGPFKIVSETSHRSYKLKLLPSLLRYYNMFHVSLLEPYKEDPIKGRK